jgi:nuclear transcription factor Y, alpha
MDAGQSAFFPQPQHTQHHPHPYGQPQQNGQVTSPNQQAIHQPQNQSSPIMSQPHAYAPHHTQNAPGHGPQMPYNTAPAYQPIQNYQLSQAAALANATAAATGPHAWGLSSAQSMGDPKGQRRSPPHQMQGRRLSHAPAASPVVQQPQLPARGGPPSAMPSAAEGGPAEDQPLYVNAKQFHRILKRRTARQKLEEALRLTSKARKPYLHESRHKHAMRRPRGPGGRFLTSEEVAAMEKSEMEGGKIDSPEESSTATTGSKRKAASGAPNSAKKSKGEAAPAVKDPHSNGDEDDDEDYGEDDG